MPSFTSTTSPTPFGLFDADASFQTDADSMVTFVKRMLGDDVLSVELTRKQIWATFERAFLEFGSFINQYEARSNLTTLVGSPTGSLSGSTHRLLRQNLQMLERLAEPYAMDAAVGGSYDTVSGSITLETGRQDYDLYTELSNSAGQTIFSTQATGSRTKLKVSEVFHFSPHAAYRYYGSTSGMSYLNTEFRFEAFTPETIFYVLPVFEDVLRAGQMDVSQRVRRSNYSYQVIGTKLRIYPVPTAADPKKVFVRVLIAPNPLSASYVDDTMHGVSSLANVPYGNLVYSNINSIGRNWVRSYTLALSKEVLGAVRSKMKSIPIPGAELQLNGDDLIAQGREEQATLRTEIKELLESMTHDKLMEADALKAEAMLRQLKLVPFRRPIIVG